MGLPVASVNEGTHNTVPAAATSHSKQLETAKSVPPGQEGYFNPRFLFFTPNSKRVWTSNIGLHFAATALTVSGLERASELKQVQRVPFACPRAEYFNRPLPPRRCPRSFLLPSRSVYSFVPNQSESTLEPHGNPNIISQLARCFHFLSPFTMSWDW